MTKGQEEARFDTLLTSLKGHHFAQSQEPNAKDIYERKFSNGSHAEIYVDEDTLTINDLELYDDSGQLIGFTHEIEEFADVARSFYAWGYSLSVETNEG